MEQKIADYVQMVREIIKKGPLKSTRLSDIQTQADLDRVKKQ